MICARFRNGRVMTRAFNWNKCSADSIPMTGNRCRRSDAVCGRFVCAMPPARSGVIYIATFFEAVYVLHAFAKKTQRTSQRDLALAQSRFRELKRGAAR